MLVCWQLYPTSVLSDIFQLAETNDAFIKYVNAAGHIFPYDFTSFTYIIFPAKLGLQVTNVNWPKSER